MPPPDSRTDEELMVLVQSGDREAFGVLFARWQQPIWGFLVRRTGDAEGSRELFQEAFLRVWRSAGTFRPGERFRPWVYRVAANLVRDRFRSSLREIDVVDGEIDPSMGASHVDPIATVDLERALAKIPENLREAFVLGAVHGLDHNEVAAILEITPANARARISRARLALREVLLATGDVPAGGAKTAEEA